MFANSVAGHKKKCSSGTYIMEDEMDGETEEKKKMRNGIKFLLSG